MALLHPEKVGVYAEPQGDRIKLDSPRGAILNGLDSIGFRWYYTYANGTPGDVAGGFDNSGILADIDSTPENIVQYPGVWNADPRYQSPAVLNLAQANGRLLLTYNEPWNSFGNFWQGNPLSPTTALDNWPALMALGNRLASPSISMSTDAASLAWLASFMAGVASRGYRVDVINIHCYPPTGNIADLANYLDKIHNLYPTYPIVVSEWSIADFGAGQGATPQQNADFAEAGCNLMDGLSYVEAHAWYAATEGTGFFWYRTAPLNADGSRTVVGDRFASMLSGGVVLPPPPPPDPVPTGPTMSSYMNAASLLFNPDPGETIPSAGANTYSAFLNSRNITTKRHADNAAVYQSLGIPRQTATATAGGTVGSPRSAQATQTLSALTQTAPLTVGGGGSTDGIATLPRVTPVLNPVPTINTAAGDTTRTAASTTALIAAINTIVTLDGNKNHEIVLTAGATYNTASNIDLPPKSGPNPNGTGWMIIRTNGSIPAQGTTVQPSDAPQMAKINGTTDSMYVLQCLDNAAHHWWFAGLEITFNNTLTNMTWLVLLGNSPQTTNMHHFIIDRCYIHGWAGVKCRHALTINTGETIVSDCWISEIHEVGAESHAIVGWDGTGPWLIQHNHLESGTGFFIGGDDPSYVDKLPRDLTIRKNRSVKPNSWFTPTDYNYLVKNCSELKMGQYVLIEDNIFDGNWEMPGGQHQAINFKANNQDHTAYWQKTEHVTFRYNIIRNVAAGMGLSSEAGQPPTMGLQFLSIHDNLFYNIGTDPRGGTYGSMFEIDEKPHDIAIFNNTCVPNFTGSGSILLSMDPRPYNNGAAFNFTFRDNILNLCQAGVKDSFAGGSSLGKTALNDFWGTGFWTMDGNVIVGTNYSAPDTLTGNTFVATQSGVGFTNAGANDYSLAAGSVALTSSHTGGRSGADITTLLARLSTCAP